MERRRFGVVTLDAIVCFLIFVVGFINFFPPIRGHWGNTYLIITALANLLLLLIVFRNQEECFASKTHVLLTMAFLVYSTAIPVIMGNSVFANRYISLLSFITLPLAYSFVRERNAQGLLGKYIGIMYLSFIFVSAITAYYLTTNPYLVRGLKNTGEEAEQLLRAGVGGYDFIYSFVLVGVLSYQKIINKTKNRLFDVAIVIASFIIVVMSNYMTALILLVLGCMLCHVIGKSIRDRFFIIIIGVVVLLSAGTVMSNIENLVATLSSDGRIGRLLSNNEGGFFSIIYTEFLADRFPTFMNSINVMTEYYGLGAIWGPSNDVLNTLGQHSHILDTFAIMGIPFGIVYFYIIMRKITVPVSFTVVFIGTLLFNNASPTVSFVFYIMVPYFLDKNEREWKTIIDDEM